MNKELIMALDALEKENGINKEIMLQLSRNLLWMSTRLSLIRLIMVVLS